MQLAVRPEAEQAAREISVRINRIVAGVLCETPDPLPPEELLAIISHAMDEVAQQARRELREAITTALEEI